MQPHEQLSSLKARRAETAGKLADLMEVQARLRVAADRENAALQAIGALGARETAAMADWARTGAVGDPPTLDMAERTKLATELAQAQIQAEAARNAAADLDRDQRRLSADLQAVNAEIDVAAYDRLAERYASDVTSFLAFIEEDAKPRLARLMAFHAMLVGRAQQHQSAGRTEAANALFRRAEVAGGIVPAMDLSPSVGAVTAEVPTWARRYAELTSDQVEAGVVVPLRTGEAA